MMPAESSIPLVRSIASLPDRLRGSVVSIGNFDGVHRGHRLLCRRLRSLAQTLGAPSMVFTFDPPPLKLLRPTHSPVPLTWMERRAELIGSLGIEATIAYPTDAALLELDAKAFFEHVLVTELGIRGIVEGPNFRFGKDRRGDVALLKALCEEHSIAWELAEEERDGEVLMSSSLIREWIEQGDMQRANRGLVEPYRIVGNVGHGAARGRTLGFPTANLEAIPVLIPAHGVYAARVVRAPDSPDALGAAVALHIGPNPTFGEDAAKVEAHLLGFSGDLYGQLLELEILDQVRGVQRFASKDALLDQLHRDIGRVESIVSGS